MGRQLQTSGPAQDVLNPALSSPDGGEPQKTWNVTLRGQFPYYRYKIGPLLSTDCRLDQGYGDVQTVAARPRIEDALPLTEGRYVLCLLAGPHAQVDDEWQQPRFATSLRLQIDTTPPDTPPPAAVRRAEDALLITPLSRPPDYAAYLFKSGPVSTTNCADAQGYLRLAGGPVTLPAAGAPALLCLIALDEAGNASLPLRQIVAQAPN